MKATTLIIILESVPYPIEVLQNSKFKIHMITCIFCCIKFQISDTLVVVIEFEQINSQGFEISMFGLHIFAI